MTSTFHLSSGYLVASVAAILFMILYPLALAVVAHRRLHVSWRYFGYGALIFFLFQIISHAPLVTVLGVVLGPVLKTSAPLRWSWLAFLAVTPGLFEEVGRYIGYRWLMGREEKTWSKAVMYGIGHGGLESIVLVAGLAILTLTELLIFSIAGLDIVPAAQRPLLARQLQAVAALPGWVPLLGAWERLWTVPIQIAQSVIVLQVFRRRNIGWLWLAIATHTVVDGTAVFLPVLIGKRLSGTVSDVVLEAIIGIFGLIAIWIVFTLRGQAGREAATELAASSQESVAGPRP